MTFIVDSPRPQRKSIFITSTKRRNNYFSVGDPAGVHPTQRDAAPVLLLAHLLVPGTKKGGRIKGVGHKTCAAFALAGATLSKVQTGAVPSKTETHRQVTFILLCCAVHLGCRFLISSDICRSTGLCVRLHFFCHPPQLSLTL